MILKLAAIIALSTASSVSASAVHAKRAVAFFSPNANGGSELDNVGGGLGEPLNVSTRAVFFFSPSASPKCRSPHCERIK